MTIHQVHEVNPFFQQALAEHRDLHQVFDRIRAAIAATDAPTPEQRREVTQMIVNLRDCLAQHFAQEERGGYLEEAVTRLPRLEAKAAALQRQHGELLDAANAVLIAARQAATPADAWNVLRIEYTKLMQRLCAHEAAENEVLQTAFNEDIGL
jgi:hemerythrin